MPKKNWTRRRSREARERIRKLWLADKFLTQVELAELGGVSQQFVSSALRELDEWKERKNDG